MSDAAAADTDTEIKVARERAGRAIRDLGHAFIGRHATVEQIDRLTEAVEAISTELWPGAERSRAMTGSSGPQTIDLPQGRFDHDFDDRPFSGRSSPLGLDLKLHRYGDEIEALVTLRAAHEGGPGRSHGGVIAALFDDVFGYVLGVIHQPAFTGELSIRYAAPTPLHRELACRVRLDERVGRKLLMSGELTDPSTGSVIVTAKATFIAVDPSVFADRSAERPAPPDEDT